MSWTLVLLIVSLILNCFLAYYSVKVARRLLIASSNIAMMKDSIALFLQSLEDVHESEMFYGDQTLQSLIDQSKELVLDFQQMEDIFSIVEDSEEGKFEEEETEN
tara:strand:- start:1703 stop:2017 length:315 start_codon:yes stop_codon:yes gene_type:complete